MSWDDLDDNTDAEYDAEEHTPVAPGSTPIYSGTEQEKKKKRLPLIIAFPASIIISIIVIIVFDLAGAKDNGAFEQYEIIGDVAIKY